MDYLHFNLVKHGLVKTVNEWPWSSFHRLVNDGVYPSNWGGEGSDAIVLKLVRRNTLRPINTHD
jgi:hypothetical protein